VAALALSACSHTPVTVDTKAPATTTAPAVNLAAVTTTDGHLTLSVPAGYTLLATHPVPNVADPTVSPTSTAQAVTATNYQFGVATTTTSGADVPPASLVTVTVTEGGTYSSAELATISSGGQMMSMHGQSAAESAPAAVNGWTTIAWQFAPNIAVSVNGEGLSVATLQAVAATVQVTP
jgi:hypothetical protein